jgi:hypothetical protein
MIQPDTFPLPVGERSFNYVYPSPDIASLELILWYRHPPSIAYACLCNYVVLGNLRSGQRKFLGSGLYEIGLYSWRLVVSFWFIGELYARFCLLF